MSFLSECSPCGAEWTSRNAFLGDPDVDIVGYRANFDDLLAGSFHFNHACGTTLSLSVRHFNGLYEGTIFTERATGSDVCPDYCLYQDQLNTCPARCECAFVRNIIDIIKKWPKR